MSETSNTSNSNRNGKRPREQPLTEFRLHIKAQDDRTYTFSFDPEKKIRKLFKMYCKRLGLDYATVDFLHEGDRVDPKRTPAQIGIDDGEIIDAMTRQNGGGFST